MSKSLLRRLVRNFSENGPKLLLENGANVRELLVLLREPRVERIDFAALTVERTHFVKPDYAHVAVDLLLKAPFRVDGANPARNILIYLLIEHQSTPERFFSLRLADYLLQAYKMQKLAWDRKNQSDSGLMFQPVLPIVLYTGERSWEKIDSLADLIEAGVLSDDKIPGATPRFLNLRDTAPETLTREGGFFGQVLRLIRDRHANLAQFRQTLEEVVTNLEAMPDEERNRWVQFLSYIEALVYHARRENEQPDLRDVVDRSIQTDPHRQEYTKMGRTIAEMYMDRGREEGELKYARATLLRLLRKRFKKVPRKVESRIASAANLHELNAWLDRLLNAHKLEDVGIPVE